MPGWRLQGVVIAVLALSVPAHAQMSFQGLNLNDDNSAPKSHKSKRRKERRHHARPARVEAPVPPPAPPPQAPPANLGLDLSGNAHPPTVVRQAPPPSVPPAAPAPILLPGLKMGGKGAGRGRLEAVAQQYKQGRYSDAAIAAYAAMQDATSTSQAAESEYLLAKSLYKMKMYHAALHHFSRVLARGERGAFFKPSLEWLFFISRKTVDDSIVLDDVARYANVEFPARYQSEFRYLLARYYMERAEALFQAGQVPEGRNSLREAQRLVEMVPNTTGYFAKARFLAGTAAYQDAEVATQPGQPAQAEALLPALAAFKEVIRVTNPRSATSIADWRTRDLAFMNLARIHYEARQNRNAIYYYGKVQRGGEQWLEALYEAAWAYYRMGDDEHALGNMITLHSPFFANEYFPESLTVKAIIYYENCRYEEASAAIDDFDRIYGPVQQELERITSREQPPSAFYDLLDDIQRKQRKQGSNALLDRILKLALSDEDLRRRNSSIQELEAEMDGVGNLPEAFRYSDLAKSVLEELKAERQAALNRAGLIARAKLEQERDELKDLLGKALRIKFETQGKQKELLEQKLAGQTVTPEELRRYRYAVAVGDDDEYWPYEGEYWRDELGTYQYTLTKGCRAGQSGADER
ncbi:MAG TPA: adventurous gliding motility protein GltC [Myxococcales bacterium]|nr:adventurous gliding motility protein GltC [Myxococcales bacterium]